MEMAAEDGARSPTRMLAEGHLRIATGGRAPADGGIAVRHIPHHHTTKKEDGGKIEQENHGDANPLPSQELGKIVNGTKKVPATLDDYRKLVVPVIEEYYSTGDVELAVSELGSLGSDQFHNYFVKKLISMAMDRHDKEKEMASVLLSALYADLLDSSKMSEGFMMLLESTEDLSVDIPDAVDVLAVFVARAIVDEILPPVFLTRARALLPESSKGIEVLQVAAAAYSATSIVVVMAKDKGRGKGTKGGAASSSGANKVDRRPPRITSNVKHNLRIVKFWKDYERKQTTGPQPATRFRKKKVMKEVLPDDTDFYEDPSATLTCTNDGSIEIASPVILVDGYNVCGYWGKLKSDFLNGNQGIARQMLIDELVSFSAVREIKVVVVFDAALSGQSTHTETYKGVDVVYSADLSADCWIEKEVEALVSDGCPKVWVVTSDVLEQQLSHGEGALIWSSKRLVKEIKESEKELDEELKEIRSTSLQGKIFQHKLKPKVVQGLKNLRNRLEEQERKKK